MYRPRAVVGRHQIMKFVVPIALSLLATLLAVVVTRMVTKIFIGSLIADRGQVSVLVAVGCMIALATGHVRDGRPGRHRLPARPR